jgi:hypothetical protein
MFEMHNKQDYGIYVFIINVITFDIRHVNVQTMSKKMLIIM